MKRQFGISEQFTPYLFPLRAVFRLEKDPGEYKLPEGWVREEKELVVIGETEHNFITELKPGSHGEWVGAQVVNYEYIIPMGPHKTRLVKWV